MSLGDCDIKRGLTETESEYISKTQEISPLEVEKRETLKEICKKLGIEHKFKDLYREDKKVGENKDK